MMEDIGQRLELAVKEFNEKGYFEIEDIQNLFSGEETNRYAERVKDPTPYNNIMKSLSAFMNMNLGEPLFCIYAIKALNYDSFKTLADRFKDDEPTKEALVSFLKLSFNHMFYETQNMNMEELGNYLPILKSWADYLSDSEVYDAVNVGLETSFDSLKMWIQDNDKEEIAELSKRIRYKLDFLREAKPSVCDRLMQELATDYSGTLRLVES